mmetsp:Transcript_30014/g.65551  ORF Transcript_30014/g.65551 Transcript_30014/m.65551 type:complete len:371 (+) Transcript_30014:72-1184(+)
MALAGKMTALILETHGKAVVVKGDTRPVKDFLKERGGSWNKGLGGWIFPGSKKAKILEDLQGHAPVSSVEDRTAGGAGPGGGSASTSGRVAAAKATAASRGGGKRLAVEEEDKKQEEEGKALGDALGSAFASPASKRPKVEAKATASQDEVVVDISVRLRCTVNSFAGSMGVDVRRFYEDRGSRELKPTPKGIRLVADEWKTLCASVGKIDDFLSSGSADGSVVKLTDEIIVSQKDTHVDIRRYYKDKSDGEQKPGKKGIFLSSAEWSDLKGALGQVSEALDQAPIQAAAASSRGRKVAGGMAGSASEVSEQRLREKLVVLLQGRDLQSLSLKIVRGELEGALGLPAGSMETRKEAIRGIVTDLVQQLTA